jgi:hypothetical protein
LAHPAEERIRQAIENGEFDNLPGKGKPFQWEDYPFEDPDQRLAYHVLRNAGYSLPWIEERQTLLDEINQARLRWKQDWLSGDAEEGRRSCLQQIKREIEALNKRIRSYNLETKLIQLQLPILDIQIELERLNVTDPLP